MHTLPSERPEPCNRADRYFIGYHPAPEVVEAAPVSTFSDLIDRYLAHPPVLPFDQSTFLALDEQAQQESLTSPFIVPATFDATPSRRETSHARDCNLIILATDAPSDSVRFLRNPKEAAKLLNPWAYAMYRSPFSTPQQPQVIIVTSSSNIPVDRYPCAVRTLAKKLRLTSFPKECLNPLNAFPLPVVFAKPKPETSKPWLA